MNHPTPETRTATATTGVMYHATPEMLLLPSLGGTQYAITGNVHPQRKTRAEEMLRYGLASDFLRHCALRENLNLNIPKERSMPQKQGIVYAYRSTRSWYALEGVSRIVTTIERIVPNQSKKRAPIGASSFKNLLRPRP